MALEHSAAWLKSDKELVLEAVPQNGGALQFAHTILRNDRDVATTALHQSLSAHAYVGESIRQDPSFLIELAQHEDEGAGRIAR